MGTTPIKSTVLKNEEETLDFSIFSEMIETIQIPKQMGTMMAEIKEARYGLLSQRSNNKTVSTSKMMGVRLFELMRLRCIIKV